MSPDVLTGPVALQRILKLAAVKRVISVDDRNEPTIKLIRPALLALMDEPDGMPPGFPRAALQQSTAVKRPLLNKWWDDLGDDARWQAIEVLHKSVPAPDEALEDLGAISELGQLFADARTRLERWTLAIWERESGKLLADPKTCCLILFDKDFGVGHESLGLTLAQELLAKTTADSVMCGIFTKTVDEDDEISQAEKIIQDQDIKEPDRLVLISKNRVKTDEGRRMVARRVKAAIMAPAMKQMREEVNTAITVAAVRSGEYLKDIRAYDFEDIVFARSQEEGIWEGETLFRLFINSLVRMSPRTASSNLNLEKSIESLRAYARVKTIRPDDQSTWLLQRREMYADADYLNRDRLPLELGDIFKLAWRPDSYFVLVEQPCDLVLRPNGRREVTRSRLLEAGLEKVPKDAEHFWTLAFIDPFKSARAIPFRRSTLISLDVLDLCVFSGDGKAVYRSGGAAPALIDPLKKRHALVQERMVERRKRYVRLRGRRSTGARDDDARASLFDYLLDPLPTNFPVVDQRRRSIDFGIERVLRLQISYAADLLREYSQWVGRPAMDM